MPDGLIRRIKSWISLEDEEPEENPPGLRLYSAGKPMPTPRTDFRRERSIVEHRLQAMEDVKQAADLLKMGVPVIITLDPGTKPGEKRRMINFLAGCCYGIDGYARKVRPDVFIFSPADFPVQSTEPEPQKEDHFQVVDFPEGSSEW